MVEKTIELTGVSGNSIEEAVDIAIARAAVTIEGIRCVRILEIVGMVEDKAVSQWRVRMALTFTVEDRLHE